MTNIKKKYIYITMDGFKLQNLVAERKKIGCIGKIVGIKFLFSTSASFVSKQRSFGDKSSTTLQGH